MSVCRPNDLESLYVMSNERMGVHEQTFPYHRTPCSLLPAPPPTAGSSLRSEKPWDTGRYGSAVPGNKGSVTIEAALLLPMVLVLCFSILFFFQMLQVQLRLQKAMDETAREMAIAGYAETLLPGGFFPEADEDTVSGLLASYADEFLGVGLGTAYAAARVPARVGCDWLDETLLVGGHRGISFSTGLNAMEEKNIDLRAAYQFRLPLLPGALVTVRLGQRSFRRMWVGQRYEPVATEEASDERQVYITEQGQAYHYFNDCMTLKRCIVSTSSDQLAELRNASGKIYYPCEYCVRGGAQAVVFYTKDGTRYHNDRQCSVLLRVIRSVPISQVEDRSLCHYCEKREEQLAEEGEGGHSSWGY